MYLAIIVLPLLGSIVSGFFGRKVGVNGAQLLSCICVVMTTLFAVAIFFEVAFNNISVSLSLFRWIDVELLNVSWGFNFDSLTVSMLIPVLIISSLVHVYSVGYMSHDPHNQRFFSYLSLFTFMMVILVTANNFLLMFVGWEGVGVCSYLLVNFWYTRIAANQSSISAFLTNRVGDCFLTIGMFIILLTFGNLDYSTVFSLAPFVSEDNITIIGICLLIGAMAKSSQFGLHVWLPLAMEGPTPVSALIHAATMVTAGVYLLMRTSPLIEYSSTVLLTCLWIGSVTTVFSSLIGLFQQDIKKVIAYSTMSQLGMMVIAVGLSSYNIALFHLINHAFYKGLLFLGAGAVIHAIADNQDFRRYGGFIIFLPLSYTVMLIASLSLVAFPFMTGFYSKDFILESSFAQYTYSGTAVFYTALIGAMFTTLYSVKVLYLTFITGASAPTINYNNAHESNIYMSLPLVILALFSIFFGFFTKDAFIGLGSGLFMDNSLFIHPLHETTIISEFGVPYIFKLLPFILTTFISIISLIVLEFYPKILLNLIFTRIGYNIFNFLNLRFLIEYIYNIYIVYFILYIGSHTTKILDKGSIEKIGPYGLEKVLIIISKNLNSLSTGVVTTYALYILIGFILYVSLPYILIDSSILILMIYCSILFTINSDKLIINNIINNNNNPTTHTIIKSYMAGTFCVVTVFSATFYVICEYTGLVSGIIENFDHIMYVNNISTDECNSKNTCEVITTKNELDTFINTMTNLQHTDFTGKKTTPYHYSLDNMIYVQESIPDQYNLDILAENLTNRIYNDFICYKNNLYNWITNVTSEKITTNDYNLDKTTDFTSKKTAPYRYSLDNMTYVQESIPDQYNLDILAENLTNRICNDFVYYKNNFDNWEYKNYAYMAIGSILGFIILYKAWSNIDTTQDLNLDCPIQIPFTNVELCRYVFNSGRTVISDIEVDSFVRHTFYPWRRIGGDRYIAFDFHRIETHLRENLIFGYNSLDIEFECEWFSNLLGHAHPTGYYSYECVWNFFEAF